MSDCADSSVRDRHDQLMNMEGLRAALAPTAGEWIGERLRGFGSTVA